MQLVQKSVSELIPYVNNSRTHSDAQIAQIAASIREFGFTNPILVDEKNNIIAGHGRLMAARLLNLTEVPCLVLSGLSDTKRKALIIADNNLALNAGWNLDALKLELTALDDENFNIDVLGFDDEFLNSLNNVQDEDDSPPLFDTEKFLIIVECDDLHDQRDLITELRQRKFKCKTK